MRSRALVQIAIFLVVAAALAYVLLQATDGWADWVVFVMIVVTAVGGAVAVWNRQYPAPTKKRTFTRDADSEW
ncbi:MAG TPA: hypothetical protein VF520_05375 [Thermoleophilaceae bacterium]|jgi:O-antigen/teichoic acid export membrane protein